MKHINLKMLLNIVKASEAKTYALITGNECLTYGDLAKTAKRLQQVFAGKTILLNTDQSTEFLKVICTAESVAKKLILLPAELSIDFAKKVIGDQKPDYIITQNPEAFPPKVAVRSCLELLPEKENPVDSKQSETQWILATSGTTGEPKLVVHTFKNLTRTTKTGPSRQHDRPWGLMYGFARFAGLQVILQSLMFGQTLIDPTHEADFDARLHFLAKHNCAALSATPTMWRKILMSPHKNDLIFKQITLGGEIADDTVLKNLKNTFPEAWITHIYAATEAGVGFSVKDGQAGFPRKYLDTPPQGIALKIHDGRLWVKNDSVHMLGGHEKDIIQNGWVDTGDNVNIEGNRVYFLGRASGVINVGGDKVHPEEVEATLSQHPAVTMVRVYGKKNPIVGALVVADVALKPNTDITQAKAEILAFAKAHLKRHMVPAKINILDTFEVTAAGKIKR